MSGAEHTKATVIDAPPTVWGLYNEKAKFRDKVLLKDWDSSINSLLLFAAIFAAVLTALCVESRKLLEVDPLNLIDQTLLYMVQRSIDPSIAPPPPREPFKPPQWAVLVNGFFFTSLTTSILAAVGAVTCLQWVEEYDAGVEAAATPKERAVRSHYRYRATERWYMRHMIASLPIILYLAVGFFFTGLALWFWQIYWMLAFIPLTGFSIWAIGYAATTLMAVFYPSAPYRTAVSKALFRVIYLSRFYAWDRTQTIIKLYRPLLKFLRHFFSRDLWNESRNQYILGKIEFSREMKLKLVDHFPWMPPGRDVHQSMHSHIREQGSVTLDETIHISTLAWLASSIDLSEDSVPKLHLVLTELNKLPASKLKHWQEHNYDAPWSHIFNMVLAPCTLNETESGENRDRAVIQHGSTLQGHSIIPTLAQILQKMSLHPTLFERMILDLDNRLLLKFMDLLKSKRPTSSANAQRRLQSITLLVSSKKWMSMSQEDQPTMSTFRVILDCLDSMQIDDGDPDISTSWIFTFCYVKTVNGDGRSAVTWPKPALIKFIPDAFTNKNLREHAIVLVLQFIDAILCDSDPAASTKWRWKWSKDSVSRLADKFAADEPGLDKRAAERRAAERHTSDKLVIMRLLVHHLLRIFFTFSESQQSEHLFNNILSRERSGSEGVTNPALRLVIMAFGGHRKEVEVPQDDDPIWNDPVWLYAVEVWFGFRTDYAVSNGREIFDLINPQQSAKLAEGFRKANPLAFIRLIKVSTELHPTLFERMILDLDNRLLLKFMDLLKSKRPTSSANAQRRLQSITLLVSSKKWMSMSQEEQPTMSTFRVILDCLDSMQINDGDPDISTSWIFTFCDVKTVNGDDRNAVTWPKPALIKYIPDVFNNQNLHEQAIVLVLQFIDAILCDSDPAAGTKWRWKWSKDSVSKLADRFMADEPGLDKRAAGRLAAETHTSDKLVIMRLLVHHILRIFFTFSESQQSQALFNDLVGRDISGGEGITNPALRLVIMAFGGHRKEVEVPQDDDLIWNDPVWLYAVSVWFGFRTDYAVSNGREIFDLINPQQSAKLVEGFRKANPLAFTRLINVSTTLRSSKYIRFWNRLFMLAPNSEREICQTLSSPLAELQPNQWFQIFADSQSKDGPRASEMLQALRGSVRTALCRQLWRKYIDTCTQASTSAQSTPLARLVQLVMDVWRAERPNRQSGALPLGMLELTYNVIRNYRNNANFERLRICVYIVDELALAYTDGSLRDIRYTQLFHEISIALRHIYMRPVTRIGSSIAPLKVPADEDPTWLAKLENTCNNTAKAGGGDLEVDTSPIPHASGVARRGTAPDTPVKEGVLHRILGRAPTVTKEDNV